VKLTANRVDGFIRSPDPAVRAVLLYGPDSGLVRERADALCRAIVPDLSDPFRVAELTPQALRDDPARLADEAASLSLTGGRRVVRLRDAADAAVAPLKSFLESSPGDALVVVEAGDLPPRSNLRKLFEAADTAAALPCYGDEGQNLEGVIRDTLRQHGQEADRDAMAYLLDHLGADRRLTRTELAKLALYRGTPGRVTLDDALACIGDGAAMDQDDLALAVAEGDQAAVQRLLDRLWREGVSPISVLRTLSRHFLRLHLAAGLIAQGKTVDQAVSALRPPPIFRVAPRIKGQVQRWSVEKLGSALDLLTAAELDCKTTGLPAEAICGRCLTQLAVAARKR
jgi:DNA polymerase-3 subunit delta